MQIDKLLLKHLTLLYVEDNKATVEAFIEAFKTAFAKIYVANTAQEGLELYKEKKPDIILADIQMPGQNGLEMIEMIRKRDHNIPIIINSAYNNPEYLISSIHLHIDEYTIKPTDPYKLMDIFKKIALRLDFEACAKNSRKKLQTIINEIPDPIIYIDTEFNIDILNEAAKRLNPEIINRENFTCYQLLYDNEKPCDKLPFACPVTTIAKSKMPVTLKAVKTVLQGKEYILDIHIRPLFHDKSGEIVGYIELIHDMTEYTKMRDALLLEKTKLEQISLHDQLTNLPNRRLFIDRIEQAIKRKKRDKGSFAVLFIDLDHFKEINDSMGHLAGDILLIKFAKRIKDTIREDDTFARLGGDEFVLLIEDSDNMEHFKTFANKIEKIISKPFTINEQKIYTSCSIGISVYPHDGHTPEKLISNADAAMYVSKRSGRHTYTFYDPIMTQESVKYLNLGTELIEALKNKEFVLHYQPIFDTKLNRFSKVEVLIRWAHKEKGFLYPGAFLEIAEKAGLLPKLDMFVFESVMANCQNKLMAHLGIETVSINVSAQTFFQEDFIEQLARLIKRYEINPNSILLEIVENQLMEDVVKAKSKLKELHKLGFRFAIDDFGTGYSSFSYLLDFSIDVIKIDRSFTNNIVNDQKALKLVKSIISLSKILECETIAEGVETLEQKELLLKEEIDCIQGFYFSKALALEDLTIFLQNQILKGEQMKTMDIHIEMKKQTQVLHDLLESMEIPKKISYKSISKQEYQRYLTVFLKFHENIEKQLLKYTKEFHLYNLNITEYFREDLLKTDIGLTGVDATFDADLSFVKKEIGSFPEAIGFLYVLTGSTMGGKILQQKIAESFEEENFKKANHYFQAFGENTDLLWKDFLSFLYTYAHIHSDYSQKIIDGSIECYNLVKRSFDAIEK